jgi:DNA-binding response OmpR family regulator
MRNVLVVEDDPTIAGHLVRGLKGAGYGVELLNSGERVDETVRALSVDCVVLDLMLPGVHGFDVLEQLRSWSDVPVIVLTARTALGDRLKSFELGATDFLPKPYFLEELLARLRVRLGPVAAETVDFADVSLDPNARVVTVNGHDAGLTPAEFKLLHYLVTRPDRAIQRETLLERALAGEDSTARAVDIHMSRLRKKLGSAGPAHLVMVRGVGYRFSL